MNVLKTKIKTYYALGFWSLASVAIYRIRLKLGLFNYKDKRALLIGSTFFRASKLPKINAPCSQAWMNEGYLFDFIAFPVDNSAPNWFRNPVTGQEFPCPDMPWWRIPDFDENVGDIKFIWELSRFSWVLPMAQRIRNGDGASLVKLNAWIADWQSKNPCYLGPNWKCAQEASIRVMNLAMAALILGQIRQTELSLLQFVNLHLERIVQTLSYASSQKNNHATSEAAALFIGGSWLEANGHSTGSKFTRLGRRQLEKHVARLVAADGSFSQHSVNYHRVFLDTISMVEVWRRSLNLSAFSKLFIKRSKAASEWLRCFIFSPHGDTPNLGANDGARLLQLGDSKYRDYRQSAQLGAALFEAKRAFIEEECDNYLAWLDLEPAIEIAERKSFKIFSKGAYAIMHKNGISAMLRLPQRKFRPSQCDALHLDVWVDGQPRLVDGGSYSYNSGQKWHEYFSGDKSHNIIQFDEIDQMTRLGRFLFGDWIECKIKNYSCDIYNTMNISAEYINIKGCSHHRFVRISNDGLTIVDDIYGFEKSACLQWRLSRGDWTINGNEISGMGLVIRIQSDADMHVELSEGFESLHYTERTSISVIEVRVFQNSKITTTVSRAI